MSLVGAFIVPHPPIIIPEVGRREVGKIRDTMEAYREIAGRIAYLKPDTLVIASPHATLYADYFHISPGKKVRGDLRKFGAGSVCIEAMYDEVFVRELSSLAGGEGIPGGTLGERDASMDHGTFIPLYFINQVYKNYKIVRMGLSGLGPVEHYRLGRCVAKTAENLNRRIVFVASGDLSHKLLKEGPYGFTPEGPEFDKRMIETMRKGDFLSFLTVPPSLSEAAAECGLKSFMIMAGALDGKAVSPELLSYEGTFGVGYAVSSFQVIGEDTNRRFDRIYKEIEQNRLMEVKLQEDDYVRLARLSLETFVKTGKRVSMSTELAKELKNRKAGVFVSLKKHGQLRGCIGTISPVTDCVAEEILRNAISAGTEDPRFSPVREEELPELVYSVDVLADPEPIRSMEELDVKRYGVIVTSGYSRGLLLPNLDGVDTPDKQVAIALQKAGIQKGQTYTMERFEVIRHK